MKANTVILVAFICALSVQRAAMAEQDITLMRLQSLPANMRTITVSGDSQVLTTPDKVVVTLSVKTFDKALPAARSLNQKGVKQVMDLLPRFKIAKNDVQTAEFSIDPVYAPGLGPYGIPTVTKPIGYSVETTVSLIIHNPASTGEIINAVLAAGANSISSVKFETTQFRKYSDQARLEALRVSRQKAEALASELGMKLSKPLHIEEEESSHYSEGENILRLQGSSAHYLSKSPLEGTAVSATPLELGQLSIQSALKVVYEME